MGDKGIGLGKVGSDAAVLQQEPCAAEDNLHGQGQEKRPCVKGLGTSLRVMSLSLIQPLWSLSAGCPEVGRGEP